MRGFKGMKAYQDRQRKFVMENGFIILNPISQHKAYIYDYDLLMKLKSKFTSDFWSNYRLCKGKETKNLPKVVKQELYKRFAECTDIRQVTGQYPYTKKVGQKEGHYTAVVTLEDAYVHPVKHFFKRKAASEKQAINYPCQGTGAVMFKTASCFLWDYLVKHDLVFKVKLCIPAHDEWNIEVPEELADEMTKVLQDCMAKAGGYFCRKLELPADAEINTYWVH